MEEKIKIMLLRIVSGSTANTELEGGYGVKRMYIVYIVFMKKQACSFLRNVILQEQQGFSLTGVFKWVKSM